MKFEKRIFEGFNPSPLLLLSIFGVAQIVAKQQIVAELDPTCYSGVIKLVVFRTAWFVIR